MPSPAEVSKKVVANITHPDIICKNYLAINFFLSFFRKRGCDRLRKKESCSEKGTFWIFNGATICGGDKT